MSTRLSIGITLAALALIVVRLLRPDLTIDAVTLGLLIIAGLPWLAPYVRSVKLPGGLEVVLKDLEDKAKEASDAAKSARQQAERAEELALDSQKSPSAPAPTSPQGARAAPAAAVSFDVPGAVSGEAESTWATQMTELAQQYDAQRAKAYTPSRTAELTKIARQMMTTAVRLENFEVQGWLSSADGGRRLGAYAYLYARPQTEALSALVTAVVDRENTPFGWYWGIMAIGKLVRATDPPARPKDTLPRLVELQAKLERERPGSDELYELSRLLKEWRS